MEKENNSNWADNFKKVVISLVLLGGAVGAGWWFLSNKKKDEDQKLSNKKSHVPGEPEAYAARLIKALAPADYFEFNVNKEDVKLTMREVAQKGIYEEVQNAYSAQTRGEYDLDADLRRRLTAKENNLITVMVQNYSGK